MGTNSLFPAKLFQQKILPCVRTVFIGEVMASDGITLCRVSQQCISVEVMKCLNYTPAALCTDWLIPILHHFPFFLFSV